MVPSLVRARDCQTRISTPLSYICTKCCKTAGGDFDFDRSLERLGIATRSGEVEKALKLEAISSKTHENWQTIPVCQYHEKR